MRRAHVEGSLARTGATAMGSDALRRAQRAMATRVLELAAPMYGPGGMDKAVDGETPHLVRSGASALRELGDLPPEAATYRALAKDVQRHAGDQATAALLLAARIVRGCLDGGAVQPLLDGLRLARRQARGWLQASTLPVQPESALASVGALDSGIVLDGLRAMADDRRIDLDDIEILPDTAQETSWSHSLVLHPLAPDGLRRLRDTRVLLVHEGLGKLRSAAAYRLHAASAGLAADEQERRHTEARHRILAAGIGLVACRKKLPEPLRDALLSRGVAVLEDCPASTAARLQACTGAAPAPDAERWDAAGLGRADMRRRPARRGGWEVRGPGPSATLLLPRTQPVLESASKDDAERMLRAAGLVLASPSALPGGGRWQRELAANLRSAADHAPGKAPLGIRIVADAFDALADDLVRNLGHDPLAMRLPPDAVDILDPAPCVRLAVLAALDTTIQVLRLDGRYDKRPSRGEDLRGGTAPAGSPKGMPGDIPPLM